MSVSAYPLTWPTGRPRTSIGGRKLGKFQRHGSPLSVHQALERLQGELDRIGARSPIISTNIETRLDGRPRSDRSAPTDPAVALYFDLKGKPHCMPCDTYTQVAQNIAALAAHIEATRAIERHGVATVAEMFTGFTALPAPGAAHSQQWWVVLGLPQTASEDDIQSTYRRKAMELHAAAASDKEKAELNVARDQALKAVRK